jgi:hypothetical protein
MNMGSYNRLSLGWFFGLAIIIHSLVLTVHLAGLGNLNSPETQVNSEPIEIERIPQEKRKPVVQTSKSEESVETENSAKYAGEFKNRVKKETQSSLTGLFREGKSPGGQGDKMAEGEKKSEEKEFSEDEEMAQESATGPKIADLMVLGRSPHHLSEHLEKGNQTILNTDKVLYASFINRIAEEVYQPWVGNIEEALKSIRTLGRKLESNTYVTKLNVSMDKAGEIKAIQILTSCGVTLIDDAPKKAFWGLESFPHPPVQLIEEDGFIRLVYEFHFEYKSSGFNIVPMTI